MLDLHREIYNAALEERREAWRRARRSVGLAEQCRELTEIRRLRPDVKALDRMSVEQTLHRLDRAFQAFYRRCQRGETPGYPRFRSRDRFDSIEWRKNGYRWFPDQRRVYLHGLGQIRVHVHRPIEGRVKTITVKREGQRWYVVLSCDQVPARPLPATGAVAGIDMGIASFLTASDGEQVPNPRHLAASAAKLTAAQQRL